MYESHLVARTKEDGSPVLGKKTDMFPDGEPLYEEVYGLLPGQPAPAPTVGVRGKHRPGEEPDLVAEEIIAAKLAEERLKTAEAESKQRTAEAAAASLTEQLEQQKALIAASGLTKEQLEEAQKKLDAAAKKKSGK